jgi:hypothetical protein
MPSATPPTGSPGAPHRAPFIVHDFVGGRRIIVDYQAPPLEPGGSGIVYVLDDGDAFKIGYTSGYLAARVAGLQTRMPDRVAPPTAGHAAQSPGPSRVPKSAIPLALSMSVYTMLSQEGRSPEKELN